MRARPPATVLVWDSIVRIGHWSMVAAVSVAWFVTEGRIHDTAGYVLLAVIAFRVAWGIFGPENARFSSFVRRPGAVLEYAGQVRAGRESRFVGHNPLGGWMIVALLATGSAVSLSGWLYTTDAFWGVEWVERLHILLAYLLLALVAIHVAGVIFTSFRQRENLLAAMIHGRKRPSDDEDREIPRS